MASTGRDTAGQVYLGLIDGGPTSDWLRRRIDWMVEEAVGPRVLDLGCGEGILEVLLARRGIAVTGVDSDPGALEFAQDLLSREPEEVRSRAELVHGDFLQGGQVAGPFDTVVMGDLLESTRDPGAMLDMGLAYLKPGGRIIVTTPFAVHPGEDHRRTFSLVDLVGLLRPRLGLEKLSVEDNGIRFVGRLSEDGQESWRPLDAEALLAMTDAALCLLAHGPVSHAGDAGEPDRAIAGEAPGTGRRGPDCSPHGGCQSRGDQEARIPGQAGPPGAGTA